MFLVPFPSIVSSGSLGGGLSPVVAAHSYCGGKRGCVTADVTNWALSPLATGSPRPGDHSPARQSKAAEVPGEHGLRLAAGLWRLSFLGDTCTPFRRGRYGLWEEGWLTVEGDAGLTPQPPPWGPGVLLPGTNVQG